MDGLGCTQGSARTLHLNKAPNWRNGDETACFVVSSLSSAAWPTPCPTSSSATSSARYSFGPRFLSSRPLRQVLLTVSFEHHSQRSITTKNWLEPTVTTSIMAWTTLTWPSLSRRTRGKVSQNEAHTHKKTKSVKVRVTLRLCPQPEGPGNREADPWKPCQNPEVSHDTPVQRSGYLLLNTILSHTLSLLVQVSMSAGGWRQLSCCGRCGEFMYSLNIYPSLCGGISHSTIRGKKIQNRPQILVKTITQERKLLASVSNGHWL